MGVKLLEHNSSNKHFSSLKGKKKKVITKMFLSSEIEWY